MKALRMAAVMAVAVLVAVSGLIAVAPTVPAVANEPLLVSVGDATVRESSGRAAVQVQLSRPCELPVTVEFGTVDGSAVAQRDYIPVGGTLVFAPGVTQLTLYVPILEDGRDEPRESFKVVLGHVEIAEIGDGEGLATIGDNDRSRRQLTGCRCLDLELVAPERKKPEAWLFSAAGLTFVNVRIPVAYKVRCEPVHPARNCAAYLILKEYKATWNWGVLDLHVLPKKLGCHGPCDGLWHRGEEYVIYTGMVQTMGSDPLSGTVEITLEGYCEDGPVGKKVSIKADVTFPPYTPPATAGTVEVGYTFSG